MITKIIVQRDGAPDLVFVPASTDSNSLDGLSQQIADRLTPNTVYTLPAGDVHLAAAVRFNTPGITLMGHPSGTRIVGNGGDMLVLGGANQTLLKFDIHNVYNPLHDAYTCMGIGILLAANGCSNPTIDGVTTDNIQDFVNCTGVIGGTITVKNCSCANATTNRAGNPDGIHGYPILAYAKKLIASANKFARCGDHGIRAQVDDAVIDGNDLCGGLGQTTCGIRITGTAIITNNTFRGQTFCVNVNADTAAKCTLPGIITIKDNKFLDCIPQLGSSLTGESQALITVPAWPMPAGVKVQP